MKRKIAILLSGTGSNAKNICAYFKMHSSIEVAMLLSNKENSGAKAIGEEFGIPYLIFNKVDFKDSDAIVSQLKNAGIDIIVLAGFLWLIPENLLEAFPDGVINIHPALLPKYGGKGMHGHFVHEAVYANKETESGITIHLCNKEYDKGKILFQEKIFFDKAETPMSIAEAVLKLEHQFFPKVIEGYILQHFTK